MTVTPFTIDVPDDVLADLRERVARSRFVEPSGSTPWGTGVDPAYLRGLVDFWRDGFDWAAVQSRLNSFPQVTVDTGRVMLHAAHLAAVGGPSHYPPIILSHGWLSTFVEMLPLAERLTDPARFGFDASLARDVVVPSLPGFLFSELPPGPLTRASLAESLAALMRELGYDRYAAFGGDIGGTAVAWLGAAHADHTTSIHMIHPPFPSSFDAAPITAEEQDFLDREEEYDTTDGGYSAIMITRPDTIGAALIDSPVGLAAWLVDKYRDWIDADSAGDVTTAFSFDDILTAVTLYWATGSIGTSMRQYVDYDHNPPRPMIDVPAAFTLSHEPGMLDLPRSIAERACSNIVRWSEPKRGGHFLAHEEPDLMAAELFAGFEDAASARHN